MRTKCFKKGDLDFMRETYSLVYPVTFLEKSLNTENFITMLKEVYVEGEFSIPLGVHRFFVLHTKEKVYLLIYGYLEFVEPGMETRVRNFLQERIKGVSLGSFKELYAAKGKTARGRLQTLRGGLNLIFENVSYGDTTIINIRGKVDHIKKVWRSISRSEAIKHEDLSPPEVAQGVSSEAYDLLVDQLSESNKKVILLTIEKRNLEAKLHKMGSAIKAKPSILDTSIEKDKIELSKENSSLPFNSSLQNQSLMILKDKKTATKPSLLTENDKSFIEKEYAIYTAQNEGSDRNFVERYLPEVSRKKKEQERGIDLKYESVRRNTFWKELFSIKKK